MCLRVCVCACARVCMCVCVCARVYTWRTFDFKHNLHRQTLFHVSTRIMIMISQTDTYD